jgi:hypothetical protein
MSQGIVIQGPTNYYREIVDCYADVPNVVFSTWDDEPQENIDYIKSKNIDIVQSPKPIFPGYLNVNYQTLSTYVGLEYLKEKGVTEALKIRGDLKPNNVKLLLEILKNKPISFLAICKPDARPLYYELEYTHTSFDFPVDLFLYGSVENLEKCFAFQIEQELPIPPESLIAYNYFLNSNLEFKLDYNTFIKNNISFFMNDCLKNNIKVKWLKQGWDLIEYSSNKNFYNY